MTGMLDGKVTLITGAGAGLGRDTALLCAREGAILALVARTEAGCNAVAEQIAAIGGTAIYVRADVSDEDQVRDMVARVVDRFGRLDCAINNVGTIPESAFTAESSTDEWNRLIAVNLTATYFCVKHEIPAMLAAGGGSIVNVASGAGHEGVPGMVSYSASKHGVIGITRTVAAEYARAGIRVNVVCPGIINTDSYRQHNVDYNQYLPSPIGRVAEPHEVAEAAIWLLSDKASYVTGHTLAIDGGRTTTAFVVP